MMGRVARAVCAGCLALCVLAEVSASQSTGSVRPSRVGIVPPRRDRLGSSRPLTPAFLSQVAPATEGRGRPSLEPARIAGELLAGAYAGIGGYFVGSWVGGGLGNLLSDASEGTKDQIAFAGGILGAGVATAASVVAIGNIGDQAGSFPTALVGTAAGVTAGLLLNQLLYGHARLPAEGESSRLRWVEASLEAMLPSIGATIAFNSTRRFK